jgi:hypothetical protein
LRRSETREIVEPHKKNKISYNKNLHEEVGEKAVDVSPIIWRKEVVPGSGPALNQAESTFQSLLQETHS